ncbi:hypothetical protein F5Y07DRAFT_366712 [Xylaria sp. FL0933]|nr:hypothetical protein F5Y07DRAFT_366712 [Xylaria sp. FL0933]
MITYNSRLLKPPSEVVFLQPFPERQRQHTTNKFAVSFISFTGETAAPSVDRLRKLFASKFKPISGNPKSFQIWHQVSAYGNHRTFIVVDMGSATMARKSKDLVSAADNLLKIIDDEPNLELLSSNMDKPLGIVLPCFCKQEDSPFPTLKQTSKTCVPIPGKWHDPNKCKTPESQASADNRNTADDSEPMRPIPQQHDAVPGYPPSASPLPLYQGPLRVSTTYPRRSAAATPPTGEVLYASRIEHPAQAVTGYPPDLPQPNYTGPSQGVFTNNEMEPGLSHGAPVACMAMSTDYTTTMTAGPPFASYHNQILDPYAYMPADRMPPGGPTLAACEADMGPSLGAYEADMGPSYPFMEWQNGYDQNYQGGGMSG